jgi:hypothetical protein
MPVALGAFLCLASGFMLVCLGWSRRSPLASDVVLRLSLSVGFGLGIISVAYFFTRVFGVANLLLVDVGVLALLLIVYLLLRARASSANPGDGSDPGHDEPRWLRRTLTAGFAFALVGAVYSAILRALANPQGDGWDAFAIWNLHARFLVRGGSHWRESFSPVILWCHPDYPLLVPASVAHFWSVLGRESAAIPAAIGLLFTFGTAGVLISGLSILRGHTAAMLGGITLLATPSFIEHGTSQYADTALSFFYLSTIVLLSLHDDRAGNDSSNSAGMLGLAGLAAGFAAWTKNEGLLFFCAIVLARCMVRVEASENWMARLRRVVPLLFAAAPIGFVLYYFKHFVAPVGGELSDPGTIVHRMLDAGRHWAIIQWYVKEFLRFGHWVTILPGTVLLIAFYFSADRETDRGHKRSGRTAAVALSFTLAGYYGAFLIAPYVLYHYLRFSMTRLYLQVWPAAIFLFFLSVKCGSEPVSRDL